MAIVATEIESIHGAVDQKRMVFYKCQDHLGVWHSYGPVTMNPGIDLDSVKSVIAAKIESSLAEAEFNSILEGI